MRGQHRSSDSTSAGVDTSPAPKEKAVGTSSACIEIIVCVLNAVPLPALLNFLRGSNRPLVKVVDEDIHANQEYPQREDQQEPFHLSETQQEN
jgi:hypothetical protein